MPNAESPYLLTRSPRRKRSVALHVEKDGGLRIMAPVKTSLKYIESFIAQKGKWIEKRRQEIAARHATPKTPLQNGSEVVFMGRKLRVVVSENEEGQKGDELFLLVINRNVNSQTLPLPCHPRQAALMKSAACRSGTQGNSKPSESPKALDPRLPSSLRYDATGRGDDEKGETAPLNSFQCSEEIDLAFRLWAKKQARRYLPERTSFWAAQTGLTPARVIVTAPEKRWGSCSAQNDVRLNWRLILAAPEIIDYVIVHELTHIKHKNHGPRFWRQVAQFIPNCKEKRKNLRLWEKQRH